MHRTKREESANEVRWIFPPQHNKCNKHDQTNRAASRANRNNKGQQASSIDANRDANKGRVEDEQNDEVDVHMMPNTTQANQVTN